MQRRQFLRGICTSAVVACPVCTALAESAGTPRWGYRGATGPRHWGTIAEAYATCATGVQQSPIDLAGSIGAVLAPLEFTYGTFEAEVEDNGHTIEVLVPPGHAVRIDDAEFTLLQFHFHAPSEHRIDGLAFPMEAHFVHRGGEGRLAVVAVMIAEGEANPEYAPLCERMPPDSAGSTTPVALEALLPEERGYYRYAGSLTTPDCAETVTWLVLRQPVSLATAQIARFTDIYPRNARPLQPANRRFVLRSF